MELSKQAGKDLGVRLAEMLRRLTVVVAALWVLITAAITVGMAIQSRTTSYLPMSNALFFLGTSALAFSIMYIVSKSMAWVTRGLRSDSSALPALVGPGTIISIVTLVGAGATIAATFPVQSWERSQAGPSPTEAYLQSLKADPKPSAPTLSQEEAACLGATQNIRRYLGTIIDQDKFQSVKLGMSYEKVVAVVGSEGREIGSRTLYDGTKASDYEWSNSGSRGGSASMHFENGILKSKTPINLPTRKEIQAAAKEYEPCR